MTHLVLKNELLDAQTLRTAGQAPYGGADLGEVLATARRIDERQLENWFDEWHATAQRCLYLARAQEDAGHAESARLAYWRASAYLRTAAGMLLGAPLDDRVKQAYAEQTDAFRRGARLLPTPPEVLEIPFENTTLPGYFFRVDDDPRQRATLLLLGGYDSTAEEVYFSNGAAGLARGYNVLIFDGPGQGNALIQQGLVMRADYEHVIGPIIDCLTTREDVDAERIALIGLSLGGHLAPRAASGEHRLAACIADCGAFDMYQAFMDRLPEPLRSGFESGNKVAVGTVKQMLQHMSRDPIGGWSLRRGLLVHGVADVMELVAAFRDFSLAGRAEQITCPTWVCNAEGDDISATAPQLVAALTCPHEFVTFTAAEGADDHCEGGARLLYHARSFGWLDPILEPGR